MINYLRLNSRITAIRPQAVAPDHASWADLACGHETILDPTAAQFKTPIPYDKAVSRGFLTKKPSKRAQTLKKRVQL